MPAFTSFAIGAALLAGTAVAVDSSQKQQDAADKQEKLAKEDSVRQQVMAKDEAAREQGAFKQAFSTAEAARVRANSASSKSALQTIGSIGTAPAPGAPKSLIGS